MNLLKDTKEFIEMLGYTPEDIIFIGSEQSGHSCSWDEYLLIANIDYKSGFGSQKIAHDLIIVFSDKSKLWRNDYDGSEWWEYSDTFKMPKKLKKLVAVTNDDMRQSLEEIHAENPRDLCRDLCGEG